MPRQNGGRPLGVATSIARPVATRLTRAMSETEAELNDRVYRMFNLTGDEIKLLQREVEH